MKMPQDFVDAINEAVKAVNPDAGTMMHGSFTLGSDFDEFFGPDAMMKRGFGEPDPEEEARFNAKIEERRDTIKTALVNSSVEIEKRRMAGTLRPFSFNDSYMDNIK